MNALADFVDAYHRRYPVNASFAGVTAHDGALPDWSPAGLSAAATDIQSWRAALTEAQAQSASPPADDLSVAQSVLDVQEAELASSHFWRRNPALFTGEAVFGVVSLLLRSHTPAAERIGPLVERLGAIPDFLADARTTLAEPAPPQWVTRAARECEGAHALLTGGLGIWCANHLPEADRAPVTHAAQVATLAFSTFKEWLATRPLAEEVACGAEVFETLLRRGHWLDQSADELLAWFEQQIQTESARLEDCAREISPEGWPAVSGLLASSHPTAEGYLHSFHACWKACRDLARAEDLVTWSDVPIRYVEQPAWARDAAPNLYFLNYRSPAADNPPPVVEYLVPPVGRPADLQAVNHSVIKSNHVVHHGAIGHHVQNAHAFRAASPLARVAGIDCASRIGMYGAGTLVEGWACYATDLMEEVGFMTAQERVAQQHGRVRQCARGIVDIALHTGRMTAPDASQYLQQTTGMPEPAAEREITRTSMFPGTGLMYAVGTAAVHDTRRAWLAQNPGRPLRDFHDTFLSFGSIPVAVIRQRMLRND